MSVLVGRRKLVVPSSPARVGNLAQGCTDRQTANNTPGRRRVAGPGFRVAGHGFSRGTASPPPPSPPPAGKVQVWPKASIPRGEGQGRGPPKTTAEAVACYTTGTWESVGPFGVGPNKGAHRATTKTLMRPRVSRGWPQPGLHLNSPAQCRAGTVQTMISSMLGISRTWPARTLRRPEALPVPITIGTRTCG
jgi:hypothetical protein